MLEGMENLIGRRLKDEYIEKNGQFIKDNGYIVTRPDFYSGNIHINMFIRFDEDFRVSDIDGTKSYGCYRGLYNRSGSVTPRKFSKRDLAYLRRFVKNITNDPA